MGWDLAQKAGGDLAGGFVSGANEVAQRVRNRLMREYGSWFLNIQSGVPWYNQGKGLLGLPMNQRSLADAVLRQIVAETEGVSRIKQMTTLYDGNGRLYSVYFDIYTTFGESIDGTIAME